MTDLESASVLLIASLFEVRSNKHTHTRAREKSYVVTYLLTCGLFVSQL